MGAVAFSSFLLWCEMESAGNGKQQMFVLMAVASTGWLARVPTGNLCFRTLSRHRVFRRHQLQLGALSCQACVRNPQPCKSSVSVHAKREQRHILKLGVLEIGVRHVFSKKK